MDIQALQGLAGLAVLVAIPIVYAKAAVFASRKWGDRGWVGAWLVAALIASAMMFLQWWRIRGAFAPDPVPVFLNTAILWAAGAWIVAISVATVLLRRHAKNAEQTGEQPKVARVGCLGFALGMLLVVLPTLLHDFLTGS